MRNNIFIAFYNITKSPHAELFSYISEEKFYDPNNSFLKINSFLSHNQMSRRLSISLRTNAIINKHFL